LNLRLYIVEVDFQWTIQHRTVLVIFTLIFYTIITAHMLSTGKKEKRLL